MAAGNGGQKMSQYSWFTVYAAGNGGQKMSQYSWFTVYHMINKFVGLSVRCVAATE